MSYALLLHADMVFKKRYRWPKIGLYSNGQCNSIMSLSKKAYIESAALVVL